MAALTMENPALTTGEFLTYLRTVDASLTLPNNGQLPSWEGEVLHRQVYLRDPVLYALLALDTGVATGQRAGMLFQLLRSSRVGMDNPARQTLERVTAVLLGVLPAESVLRVFLALRRVCANHKHTARAIAGYLLDHPHAEELVARRRPAVADCLEHAFGKSTLRGSVRALTEGAEKVSPHRLPLLRLTHKREQAATLLPALYPPPLGIGLRSATEGIAYRDAHRPYEALITHAWERPATITAANRGEIAATLVALYRDGSTPELEARLGQAVAEQAACLPRFGGRIALVLDVSASMQSYGDREYCILAQAVALQRVLAAVCAVTRTVLIGGQGNLPRPQGHTDLAGGLLEALTNDPDLAVLLSDGYENIVAGDLARVVASLPCAGITTPVVFCHSKFTNQDDLTFRRPAPNLPELAFWHQEEFESLLLALFARARPPYGDAALREFLGRRLNQLEAEGALWTTRHSYPAPLT